MDGITSIEEFPAKEIAKAVANHQDQVAGRLRLHPYYNRARLVLISRELMTEQPPLVLTSPEIVRDGQSLEMSFELDLGGSERRVFFRFPDLDGDLQHHGEAMISVAMYLAMAEGRTCLLYTSPSPRDLSTSRMPSSA